MYQMYSRSVFRSGNNGNVASYLDTVLVDVECGKSVDSVAVAQGAVEVIPGGAVHVADHHIVVVYNDVMIGELLCFQNIVYITINSY